MLDGLGSNLIWRRLWSSPSHTVCLHEKTLCISANHMAKRMRIGWAQDPSVTWAGWNCWAGIPCKVPWEIPCGQGWEELIPGPKPGTEALPPCELRIYAGGKPYMTLPAHTKPPKESVTHSFQVLLYQNIILTYIFGQKSFYINVQFWIDSGKFHWQKLWHES